MPVGFVTQDSEQKWAIEKLINMKIVTHELYDLNNRCLTAIIISTCCTKVYEIQPGDRQTDS